MAITPAGQRNAASEGTALGLILSGVASIPFNKVNVDLAFEGAWRNWQYRSHFPQVSTDVSKGLDGSYAMTHASEGRHVWVLFWDRSGRDLVICPRTSNWDADDDDDVDYALRVIDGDVPREGWVALAQDFLSRLSPNVASVAP